MRWYKVAMSVEEVAAGKHMTLQDKFEDLFVQRGAPAEAAMCRSRDVMSNEPLDEKWRTFGWAVKNVNGHDYRQLTEALSKPVEAGKPTCVIANTTKGKGVSFMENKLLWHYRTPDPEELRLALMELGDK